MNKNIYDLMDKLRNKGIEITPENMLSMMLSAKRAANDPRIEFLGLNVTDAIKNNNVALGVYVLEDELCNEMYDCLKDCDLYEMMHFILDRSKFGISPLSMQTPRSINEFFIDEMKNPNYKSILISEAEHYLYSIKDLAESYNDKTFTIGALNDNLKELLQYYYRDLPNVNIISLNIYDDVTISDKFDLITCVPAFGRRGTNEFDNHICRELDLAATENLLGMISEIGKLLIVLPARITFGGGSIAVLRKHIEQNYGLAKIKELPTGILKGTGVKTYYFEFTASEKDKILISSYKSKNNKTRDFDEIVCDKEMDISAEKLYEMDNWQINRILSDIDQSLQSFYGSSKNKVKLKDVSEIFRGKTVNNKTIDGNIGVINISNINENGIDYDHLEKFTEEERKVKRYELQEGDVLLTCRGTTIKSATFTQQSFLCIPSVSLVVIRPNKELNSRYLEVFFQTPIGKAVFDSFSIGGASIQITHKDVMEITIPLPSLEEQLEIVKKYDSEKEIFMNAVKTAENRWSATLGNLLNDII